MRLDCVLMMALADGGGTGNLEILSLETVLHTVGQSGGRGLARLTTLRNNILGLTTLSPAFFCGCACRCWRVVCVCLHVQSFRKPGGGGPDQDVARSAGWCEEPDEVAGEQHAGGAGWP